MFRRVTTQILSHRRHFSSPTADELFVQAWKRIAPNVDPPKTPLTFALPRSTPTPSKLILNLFSPYSSNFSNKQVDMVTIPAATGQMGVLPGHGPSISELKPGLLSIHEGNEVTKYFISSGFAYVHSRSITDILAVEVVPIEQIDGISVQNALAEVTQKLSSATTDLEKVEAQTGMDVLTALNLLYQCSCVDGSPNGMIIVFRVRSYA